ncbi:hypothetical protein [Leifsonia shinshuensis]|uniref:Esterase-like activity of phytase family protein n=1 Tax=Leifsonia shinshuensis TaxID=150026 RepID=A0A7G6YEH0_9MICO|nr:hypothetical protein [Leifsonia shinshuensis]QNE36885.1 hypothetical protein F1C12_18365 [Leifsonia shinshuensis]
MSFTARTRACLLVAGIAATTAVACAALPAAAAPTPAPAHSAFTVHAFPAVGAEKSPDDITRLGDSIYVTFQNGVGPMGEAAPSGATASTIQQYSLAGVPGRSWSVTGKVDGLTADPEHHRLLLTANEDGNSSFLTLDPRATAATRYAYQGLTHGGGTDAISVVRGSIVVSASNPTVPNGPAAYRVALQGSNAVLTPVLSDNSVATSANAATAGQTVQLALTDPDSNTVVPRSSSRFGGSFLLDAQGDQQLLFLNPAVRDDAAGHGIQVLSVAQPLDDTAFATASRRTLWATDPAHDTVDEITGPFAPGEAVSAVTPDSGPTSLARLGLTDGSLTPIAGLSAVTPKGLLFTSSEHGDDQGDQGDQGDRQ